MHFRRKSLTLFDMPPDKTLPIFEIDAVSKIYAHPVLKEISLTIEKGDIFGIIGLSGAGKSTLIRCLSRLVTPTSGKVLFQGKDLAQMEKAALRKLRKNIGMIFQHFNLLSSRTVAENIAYPLEISGISQENQLQRTEELLTLVGLKRKKNQYPSKLSGGEKQRVGIARALATYPEVLLCDEATSALDPKTTREILQLLKNINTTLGVTIVLITHEMEVIKQICNKVAVIEQGALVEKGDVSSIFADPVHSITKQFLQHASHEIPREFFKEISPNRKLLKLRFKGEAAGNPIISEIVRKYHVDANILLGWIDRIHTLFIGTLVIELTGPSDGIESALSYLKEKNVHYEVLVYAG